MHGGALEDNRVMWLSVYTESSQKCLCSGAGASVLQVKTQWTFTGEGTSCVHTSGANRAGVSLTLIHILVAGQACPCLLTVAGEVMPFIAHTHPPIHTRVGHTRVSWWWCCLGGSDISSASCHHQLCNSPVCPGGVQSFCAPSRGAVGVASGDVLTVGRGDSQSARACV